MVDHARLEFERDPQSVAEARALVTDVCDRWPGSVDGDAARLLVSELVTNVIRHTADGCGVVRIGRHGDRLRIEVSDRGAGGPPRRRRPDPGCRGGGYGLLLVERLSRRWGSGRQCVWFELDGARSR